VVVEEEAGEEARGGIDVAEACEESYVTGLHPLLLLLLLVVIVAKLPAVDAKRLEGGQLAGRVHRSKRGEDRREIRRANPGARPPRPALGVRDMAALREAYALEPLADARRQLAPVAPCEAPLPGARTTARCKP
jgi:hypothetical protein